MRHRIEVLVEGRDLPPFRASTVLVWGGRGPVVIDPGAASGAAAVVEGLARHGLAPGDVQTVVATHLHDDHSESAPLFQRAELLVGAGELAALHDLLEEVTARTGVTHAALAGEAGRGDQVLDAVGEALRARYQAGNGLYLNRIARGLVKQLAFLCGEGARRRLRPVAGELELADGLRVLPTPGHTPGHLSVLIPEIQRGGACLVAGDAFPTGQWLGRDDASLPFCVDVAQFLSTKRALERAADWIVPGHGAMFAVAEAGRST